MGPLLFHEIETEGTVSLNVQPVEGRQVSWF